jgi:hypothetical protein
MTLHVDVDAAKLDSLADGLMPRLSAVVRAHALQVEAAAKVAIMTGAKTGRVYLRPNGRSHRSSAQGEAPANDTGNLAGSIRARGESPLTWRVSADARYAAPLELGTERIAPRPFLTPALESVKASFLAAIKAVFS